MIFVLIVSAQSDVFSGNTPNEKTYGLEIKPWPRNRSQVLSILENSVWLTEKLRNYSGSKMFHKKNIPISSSFALPSSKATPCEISPSCFTLLFLLCDNYDSLEDDFFFPSLWINTALLPKAIA